MIAEDAYHEIASFFIVKKISGNSKRKLVLHLVTRNHHGLHFQCLQSFI